MKPIYCQRLGIFCLAAAFNPYGVAEVEYGRFPDPLMGTFNLRAESRPLFLLENQFRFIDPNGVTWTAPKGTEVDGASIPQAFWSYIGGPFEGSYINASVIHDYYCESKTKTAHDTHRNFYYGMRAAGVPEWKASLMHWIVNTFGPDWRLEKRVRLVNDCKNLVTGGVACTSSPVLEEKIVTLPSADLSDPEVLAVAIGKANAIAKNLLTSQGQTLEKLNDQAVSANLDNIEASASSYRQMFVKKDFYNDSKNFGILAELPKDGPLHVQPWESNFIPAPNDATPLTPATAAEIPSGKGFVLEANSEGLIERKIDLKSIASKEMLNDLN